MGNLSPFELDFGVYLGRNSFLMHVKQNLAKLISLTLFSCGQMSSIGSDLRIASFAGEIPGPCWLCCVSGTIVVDFFSKI